MTQDVQLDEPAEELLATATVVVPGWLRRITLGAASRSTVPSAALIDDIDQMVAVAAPALIDRLRVLLATDVDLQTTNPLSIFRDGIAAPTRLLRSHGVHTPPTDAFAGDRFPDDVYRLGPATWADIDPALHVPGLTWGASKAMTVLRRRRDEGLR